VITTKQKYKNLGTLRKKKNSVTKKVAAAFMRRQSSLLQSSESGGSTPPSPMLAPASSSPSKTKLSGSTDDFAPFVPATVFPGICPGNQQQQLDDASDIPAITTDNVEKRYECLKGDEYWELAEVRFFFPAIVC
jgi:hypothetical protein